MQYIRCNRGLLILSALALIVFTTGCDDFLTENNKSAITQENYYQTAEQARSAVNGIYPSLRSLTSSTGYGESNWLALELLVGHAFTNGQSDRNRQLIAHAAGSEHPVFNSYWDNFYYGISNANVAIHNIPNIEMDETLKNQLLGEARFLRALYSYYLVRLFGEIPLITEPVNATSPDLYPQQASIEAVYDQILADLEFAENAGLPFVDRTGRVSTAAVKSLLASVHLTMAGHPLNKGADSYAKAAQKAEEVIDSGQFTLFDDYHFLHDRAHRNQGEFIFQVQYEKGIATNSITQLIIPENEGISPFGDEYGSLRPVPQFVESYEEGDKRTNEREFFVTRYTLADGTVKEFGEYALYKFWLDEAAGLNGDQQNDMNWTIFRLPEIMLIYAEAVNELNGPTQKAYDQINAIRARAELEPLSGLSQEEFRQAVWRERYHELAYENKAYFDIQRTHMVYDLGANRFVDAFSYTNVQGTQFTPKYMLWAIPSDELNTNPNLRQNPGW